MRNTKILILFLSLLVISSCGTIRLRYEGQFKTEKEQGTFVYERSYEVGSLQTFCIITGILYGGACWGYLGLPSASMRDSFKKDAQIKLSESTGLKNISYPVDSVERFGWSEGEIFFQYHLSHGTTGPIQNTPKNEQPPQAPSSSEFLR